MGKDKKDPNRPIRRTSKCPQCNGRGYFPSRDRRKPDETCKSCGGAGEYTVVI